MASEIRRRTPEDTCAKSRRKRLRSRRAVSRSSWAMPPASASHSGCSTKRGGAASADRTSSSAPCSRTSRPKPRTLLQNLEVIPLKVVGQGTAIDVETLIRRHPAVCVIDGLAYDNPPGFAIPRAGRMFRTFSTPASK